ncbi:PAS domain-containing protein [Nibribacter ruber]|uniref:PAS domain-containing protein n=1 Tax=Nibribacter ruber TaxID=2698458 RepID=A0A6P1NSD8_9BACT|nr:GAF domain-containing protein [Nibribacter ruber]QHL86597.1 PAS domain-containing protein [Nibribacter ruber]
MQEAARIQELREYRILDTLPEKELDELVEITSAINDAPICLLTFIDKDRQWFKSVKGLATRETLRQDSFCRHALEFPKEVLVVTDPCNDPRFKNNPFVVGLPGIKFYAGAPLETPKGYVLGTLCIIDTKPREFSDNQKKALQLLAKKAMDYLETRKQLLDQDDLLEHNITRLRKLTDQAPGAIYQLELSPDGRLHFPFISKGFATIHPMLDPQLLKENAEVAFTVIHPDDVEMVRQSLIDSFTQLTNWEVEYRVLEEEGEVHWHWSNAKPERKEDGTVVWYGTFQDITQRKEYIQTLEQILFDISHVMRKPVATLLGLTTALQSYPMDPSTLHTYVDHIQAVSKEMDAFIHQLNDTYQQTITKVTKSNGQE